MIRQIEMFMLAGALLLSATSCGTRNKASETTDTQETTMIQVPTFDADSAYHYIGTQVAFGPRVPNSEGHKACASYLSGQLKKFGAKVTEQPMELTAYDGTLLHARNIIGSYLPENRKRIALFAHWDTRPWADRDPESANHYKPIPGANDGASGVGVLLEIARQLQKSQPKLGVDIIFLDAEDYGTHSAHSGKDSEENWCLGAQYWARNPHVSNYNARFGILLDMVGGKNALFYREYFSEYYAKDIVDKVWKAAEKLEYSNYFINEALGAATDDHLFINRIAGIKTIDIVPSDPEGEYSFDPTWHTMGDDMSNIDKRVLKAVGQTVLEVIYHEK